MADPHVLEGLCFCAFLLIFVHTVCLRHPKLIGFLLQDRWLYQRVLKGLL